MSKPYPKLEEIKEKVPSAMKRSERADGKRRISLTDEERRMFSRQQKIETAVAMFLDIETGYSWQEIANELGITVNALKGLTKSDDFMNAYAAHYAELGHDPRLAATRAALADMLPAAVRTLKEILADRSASPSARIKAVEDILRLNGIDQPKNSNSDKSEMIKFLNEVGVKIGTLTINVPQQYAEKLKDYSDVVNVTPVDLPSLPTSEVPTSE